MVPDALDVTNLAFYLDLLPTQVPLYVKNSNGSLTLNSNGDSIVQLDSNGDPINVNCYKVAWVIDKTITNISIYAPGLLTQRNGIQTSGSTQSIQYSIFEFVVKDPGEFGNKLAVRLYPAIQSNLVPFPINILSDGKLYPFYFSLFKLIDTLTGKTSALLNSFGAQYIKFIAKNKGIDPGSGTVIDINKVLTDQYIYLPAHLQTGLGYVHVYYNNLQQLLTDFYNSEKNYLWFT